MSTSKRSKIRDVIAVLKAAKNDPKHFNPMARMCNVHFEHYSDCPIRASCEDHVLIFDKHLCTCTGLGAHLHPHELPDCDGPTIKDYVEGRYLEETGKAKSFREIQLRVSV